MSCCRALFRRPPRFLVVPSFTILGRCLQVFSLNAKNSDLVRNCDHAWKLPLMHTCPSARSPHKPLPLPRINDHGTDVAPGPRGYIRRSQCDAFVSQPTQEDLERSKGHARSLTKEISYAKILLNLVINRTMRSPKILCLVLIVRSQRARRYAPSLQHLGS